MNISKAMMFCLLIPIYSFAFLLPEELDAEIVSLNEDIAKQDKKKKKYRRKRRVFSDIDWKTIAGNDV